MTTAQIGITIAIIAYMAIIIYIGVRFSKRNRSSDDFYLGGRTLGPIVTAMSAEASDMSSWLLMGLPGLAFISGIASPFWTALGLGIGTYLNWLIVAKRLRRYSERIKVITIPNFFEKRFHDKTGLLVGISAIWILIFFVPYTASGFSACGKLFSKLFNVPYFPAMVISAIVIVFYTMLGGFLAASFTDLIQSIVMTAVLFIVIFYGIMRAGGWDNVVASAESVKGYLSLTMTADVANKTSAPYSFLTIVSTLAWGLGYFGMPHILLRFMAIKDDKKIKLSRRIATIWVFISMGAAILIGLIGYAMSQEGVIDSFANSSEAENTVVEIANILSKHGIITALIAGVILAGILACTMSTADSQLLAASSSFSQNLLVDVFHLKLSEKQKVRLARITVLVIAAISIVIARDPGSSVFKIVSFAWAGFGASFGPVMLLALFWRRANRHGALAGMLSGGIMIFIWKFFIRPLGGNWDIYELLPAFIVSLVFTVIVSLITPAPSASVTKEFDDVQA